MFERFTTTARATVTQAQREGRGLGSPVIGTEHLLLALTDDAAGIASSALASLGIGRQEVLDSLVADRPAEVPGEVFSGEDAEALRAVGIDVDAVLRRISQTFGADAVDRARRSGAGQARRGGHIPFAPDAKEALRCALLEAMAQRTRQLDDGAVLLGVVAAGGTATRILAQRGVDAAAVRHAVDEGRRRSA